MDMSELRDSAANEGKVKGEGNVAWTAYPAQIWEGLRDLAGSVIFIGGSENTSPTARCNRYWMEETGTNRR